VSATVAPDTIRAQVKVFSPAITQTSTGVSGVPDEAVGVLIAMRWTLYRYEPTVPDGSYTYMLHDAEGKLLAIAEHFEADTALLAVIEEVLPASEK
jgi:hypothetical protein